MHRSVSTYMTHTSCNVALGSWASTYESRCMRNTASRLRTAAARSVSANPGMTAGTGAMDVAARLAEAAAALPAPGGGGGGGCGSR